MKYFLVFLCLYTIGIQASNYSSIENNSFNLTEKNLVITPIYALLDSEITAGVADNLKRQSSDNSDLLLLVITHTLIFILGFICAVIYYNRKIRSLLDKEFDTYNSEYKKRNGGFSFMKIGIIKILKEQKDEYKSKSNQTTNVQSKPTIIRAVSQPSSFENPASNTKKVIEESEDQESSYSVNWDNPSPQPEKTMVPEEIKQMVLFFSLPDEDGSFSLDNSSISPTSRSYYKVEYTEGDNKGKLIYRSGDLDISALSQMDYILSPVCDIENSSMPNPTVIYIESDGEVIKEGDSWKIDQKIKIRLS
jgi:hypothetical protein